MIIDHVDNSDDGGCGDHHEGNDYYCHDENGRFFPTHVTLQSHEDTRAYANVYNYVKEGLLPRRSPQQGKRSISLNLKFVENGP